eukprot:scaffold17980_cov77-Isochrysis_galbana.AAC.3
MSCSAQGRRECISDPAARISRQAHPSEALPQCGTPWNPDDGAVPRCAAVAVSSKASAAGRTGTAPG